MMLSEGSVEEMLSGSASPNTPFTVQLIALRFPPAGKARINLSDGKHRSSLFFLNSTLSRQFQHDPPSRCSIFTIEQWHSEKTGKKNGKFIQCVTIDAVSSPRTCTHLIGQPVLYVAAKPIPATPLRDAVENIPRSSLKRKAGVIARTDSGMTPCNAKPRLDFGGDASLALPGSPNTKSVPDFAIGADISPIAAKSASPLQQSSGSFVSVNSSSSPSDSSGSEDELEQENADGSGTETRTDQHSKSAADTSHISLQSLSSGSDSDSCCSDSSSDDDDRFRLRNVSVAPPQPAVVAREQKQSSNVISDRRGTIIYLDESNIDDISSDDESDSSDESVVVLGSRRASLSSTSPPVIESTHATAARPTGMWSSKTQVDLPSTSWDQKVVNDLGDKVHLLDYVNCCIFKHARFRSAQRQIIEAALQDKDVFVLMPTGTSHMPKIAALSVA